MEYSFDQVSCRSRFKTRHPAISLLGSTLLVVSMSSHAYFVQPVVQVGGEFVNGLDENGATSGSEGIAAADGDARADIDLNAGEMHLFASGSGTSAFSSGQGLMGDTVTFTGGQGSNVAFSFGIDGTVEATLDGTLSEFTTLQVRLAVGVFDTGLVDASNWFGNALQNDPEDIMPLFFEQTSIEFADDLSGSLATTFDEMITGSLALASDNVTLDFFYLAGLQGASNGAFSSFILDAENTATASITVGPDVSTTSGSGTFLGFPAAPAAVPLPGSVALFGLAAIALLTRRH